jgi:hypothetical protein
VHQYPLCSVRPESHRKSFVAQPRASLVKLVSGNVKFRAVQYENIGHYSSFRRCAKAIYRLDQATAFVHIPNALLLFGNANRNSGAKRRAFHRSPYSPVSASQTRMTPGTCHAGETGSQWPANPHVETRRRSYYYSRENWHQSCRPRPATCKRGNSAAMVEEALLVLAETVIRSSAGGE